MVVGEFSQETDLLVIGGGPGGYHAAFRAAENGIKTTIVEMMPKLGGVCLHRGCIPSKTFLSMAELLHSAQTSKNMGISFTKPRLQIDGMRSWKAGVVQKLADGLDSQCKRYKVERIRGKARFEDGKTVALESDEVSRIKFRKAIIATGSRSIRLKGIQIDSPLVMTSRGALELERIPKTLLVIGGGYIGLELGQVYASFGSKVTVVEMLPGLLPGADRDLARPLVKRLGEQFEEICVETKVSAMKEAEGGISLEFEGKNPPKAKTFEKVLVSVGRYPNSGELDLEKAGVQVDERGFIKVDKGFKTTSPRIYAIGDVIGDPMLAHKALHEGRVVADIIAGKDAAFEPRAIPAVVFTDPEIAWAGYTQEEAKTENLDIDVKKIPFGASGRAVALGRTDGLAKLIFDKSSKRLIGMGLTGPHVGEMIAEGVLAMEMGAVAYDLASTVHPHPTISEMIGEAAAMLV
ncbi:MAG: dihydrolipoyl dehydrogenase [Phycisphaerales bacterium]|nr:MAG: dihydrolipoyl dehydrogenase [Phycisphaerales bacterium]